MEEFKLTQFLVAAMLEVTNISTFVTTDIYRILIHSSGLAQRTHPVQFDPDY
jgi:hypothetical protein